MELKQALETIKGLAATVVEMGEEIKSLKRVIDEQGVHLEIYDDNAEELEIEIKGLESEIDQLKAEIEELKGEKK